MSLNLKTALADYDRVRPILDGEVNTEKVTLDAAPLAPSEIFFRLLSESAFDVAEMSLSSYFISQVSGWGYTAIPVFPSRRLFHLNLWTAADGPAPDRLNGTRIGLTEYQVTAAVWTRGILADDWGLDLASVDWFVERTRELSHGGETGFAPPADIRVSGMQTEDTLYSALDRRALDVVLPSPYPGMNSRLNRTDEQELETSGRFRPLFTDPRAEASRCVAAHGFLPMNHTVVIRTSLLEEHPWLAREVFTMFCEAKRLAQSRLSVLRRSHLVLAAHYLAEERALFGADPYPYGLAANRDALTTLARYLCDQGLIPKAPEVDSLFEDSLLDT
ncbi:hypothetical protein [Nocardiopsis nanhaiensis]